MQAKNGTQSRPPAAADHIAGSSKHRHSLDKHREQAAATSAAKQTSFRRLAVFCGSNWGRSPLYAQGAKRLAAVLAARNIEVVYGGSSVGLMHELAVAAHQKGQRVIGVIPHALISREGAQSDIAELRIVDSMHQRKALMAELADGFVVMPGGLGTLEEFFEVATWAQLGIHRKPCGILNLNGYYDPLLQFLDHAQAEGFIRGSSYRRLVAIAADPEPLIALMERFVLPKEPRWISLESS